MATRGVSIPFALLAAAAGLVLSITQASPALAAQTRGGNDVTVAANETIDDDLYALGATITVLGKVTGSVLATGNNVTVSGEVGGDVMAAGSTVVIDGPVHGTVRAVGQSVQVRAAVDHDVVAAANSVALVGNGRAGRDLLAAANNVTIAAPVGRNVTAGASTVDVSSTVGGKFQGNVSLLRLEPTARVQGDVAYTSDNQAVISPGATIGGAVTRTAPAAREEASASSVVIDWLKGLIGIAALGLVLLLLFPHVAQRGTESLRRSPWVSLGLGALVLIVTPVLAVALSLVGLLVNGWWLGIPVLGGYLLWLVAGYLAAAVTLGREALERARQPARPGAWSVIVGVAILGILGLVPYLGGLVGLAAVLLGSGALLLMLYESRSPQFEAGSKAPGLAFVAPVEGS